MLEKISELVWGIPLISFILAIGIYLTVQLKGIQIRRLPLAIKCMLQKNNTGQKGDVSSFGALCMMLSATIGTGSIVGVATALVAGGPGALFWMWISALFGAGTMYGECLLGIKYRVIREDGHVIGGPFYYIENGMGIRFRWLAKLFALFGVGAGILGIGTFAQISGVTRAVKDFFDPHNMYVVKLFGMEYSWSTISSGIVISVCAGFVLIGGVKRISTVAQMLVPFMTLLYVGAIIIILVTHIERLPQVMIDIIEGAFGLRAATGGALGAMMVAVQMGVARGIFSNEAGLGSAPIAAASVRTDEPVEQGLVSMLGTVIDTLIICTMTGLAILLTDTWNLGLDGVSVTTKALQRGLPFSNGVGAFILMISLVFFAFSSMLGWNYYSERCMEYLVGDKPSIVMIFRWGYILAIFLGAFIEASFVWKIADIFNGLMAFPNLIAVSALSGVIIEETRDYFLKKKK